MIIETKFNTGEKVVFINGGSIITRKVTQIAYRYGAIYYTFVITKAISMSDRDTEVEMDQRDCWGTVKELAEFYEDKQ